MTSTKKKSKSTPKSSPGLLQCERCEAIVIENGYRMGCGHFHCQMCLSKLVGLSVEIRVKCSVTTCGGFLNEAEICRLLGKEVYDALTSRVDRKRSLRRKSQGEADKDEGPTVKRRKRDSVSSPAGVKEQAKESTEHPMEQSTTEVPIPEVPVPEVVPPETLAVCQQANMFYKQAQTASGISRPLKRSLLERTSRIYAAELQRLTAAEMDKIPETISSLYRNRGMANLRLSDVVDALDRNEEFRVVTHFLKEAVGCFSSALIVRSSARHTAWGMCVEEKILDCFELGLRRGESREFKTARLMDESLDKMFEAIPMTPDFSVIRAKCHLAKVQHFYTRALILLDRSNSRSAIQLLEYAREEKELAAQSSKGNEDLTREIILMEQDITMFKFSCESVRIRTEADDLFTRYVNDVEFDFRMMWTILDMYKDAVLLTRERDIENEACALSRLGRMYDKIFKLKGKAHAYYRRTFDLVQTLLPKDMSKCTWYSECKEALERFQRNIILEEQKKEEAEKAPILEKLGPEIKVLQKVNSEKGVPELLKYLYTKYPPKVSYEFNEEDMEERIGHKQVLMKAITHYHPDRQVNFGLEWKVLCGEITKILTVRYETFK